MKLSKEWPQQRKPVEFDLRVKREGEADGSREKRGLEKE